MNFWWFFPLPSAIYSFICQRLGWWFYVLYIEIYAFIIQSSVYAHTLITYACMWLKEPSFPSATAFVKKEPLESSTLRAVTREQSQPCPSTHRVTQTSSRPSSMDSRTAQQSIGPCMLEVQEGILDEVQGIRSALECQTAALQRINETLLGLTNALNVLSKS